jgi:hypothetical protein
VAGAEQQPQHASDDMDAEVAAEVEAAGGQLERSSGDPQEGSKADPRLGDPVAKASDEANSNRDTAGIGQQAADSSAADQMALPGDAAAEPERKQPRQQQSVGLNATDAQVGQKSDGSTEAAAQLREDSTQSAGQDIVQEDVDSEELAVDQEDYNDAELQ